MPRFVLLYHDCPPNYERPSHWDLMFESGDMLRTWALECLPRDWQAAHSWTAAKYPHCPSIAAGNAVAATQLGNHRREYLEIEGPLSGERGRVIRVAAGTYLGEAEFPGRWQLTLTGIEISGRLKLTSLSSDATGWTLECLPAG